MNSTQHLYNAKDNTPYPVALDNIRAAINLRLEAEHAESLSEAELKGLIGNAITETGQKCALTSSVAELTHYMYHDMAGYSFITREGLFDVQGFEELNVNGWDDIDIRVYGKTKKTHFSFLSPEHAVDIHKRMLRKTKVVMDNSMPRAVTDLGESGQRICVEMAPVVDADVGIASVIRKVQSASVTVSKIVEGGGGTEEMCRLILLCLRHGVSACVGGGTGSGKTTTSGALLTDISQDVRMVTIEEGSREWNFRRYDEKGRPINSVVHLKTRPSDTPSQNVDQKQLVKDSLRLTPGFLGIGEIRGEEAFEVISAALTGHTTLTTVHANDAKTTPKRLVTLAKKAYAMDDATLYDMVADAFPLLIHMKLYLDGVRRISEIAEITGLDAKDRPIFSTLFRFQVEDNIYEDEAGKPLERPQVVGAFQRQNPISESLFTQLLENGGRRRDVLPFYQGGADA